MFRFCLWLFWCCCAIAWFAIWGWGFDRLGCGCCLKWLFGRYLGVWVFGIMFWFCFWVGCVVGLYLFLEWDFWNLIVRLFEWVGLLCLGGLLFIVCRNYVLLVLWFSNFGDFVGLVEFCVCVALVFCLLWVVFVVLMIWRFLSRVCFEIWLNLVFGSGLWLFRLRLFILVFWRTCVLEVLIWVDGLL